MPEPIKTKSLADWERWVATRPETIQALIKEFPPMQKVELGGVIHYVLGWREPDQIILSKFNPATSYSVAREAKVYLCAKHVRADFVKVPE